MMGANTTYYVTVYKLQEHVVEVSALTRMDAEEEALRTPGVVGVKEVLHWTELNAARSSEC
jgi:hypothetical protein